ncbi:MAG TPA: DUF1326 domain-containing protein [Dehalococcoidia bacterium]|nr:DUF1326 domain-containing protein [Dehalococcoidia bacterium]
MTGWSMRGHYLKNCNCLASCPCDTIGVPAPNAFCEGVAAMEIVEGHYDGLPLDGLRWAVAAHWPGAIHEGNGTVELFIDERADSQQRQALLQVLSGQAGGTLFEIMASVVQEVVGPHFVPIHFEFDKARRRARLSIPGFAETVSAPLTVPATGEEQRVIVCLPDGFEYKEMEVAQATVLRSSGAVRFDWQGTHSSLAEVTHTEKGLQA